MPSPAVRAILMGSSAPKWVLSGNPQVQVDYVNGRAWRNKRAAYNQASIISLHDTFSTPAMNVTGSDGIIYPIPANSLACFNMPAGKCTGQLVESSRTNVVLWNRDLTNAVWTKSNVTAAKDQSGADGVTNSASSITATAANGTVLQAITLGSSGRFQTAYVKRLTGTGAVSMTMDGGTTWTAITLTAAWKPVSIPTQTIANPNVGFRLATSGDSIGVDFVQNENGAFATSPIATTSASVNRAASTLKMTMTPAEPPPISRFKRAPMASTSLTFMTISARNTR